MFDSFEKSLKLISRLDLKAIEHAFPTVIWDKKIGGGLFSYDIESGWKFFNDCPNDCCWKSIIDELPVQLEMLLQKITVDIRLSHLKRGPVYYGHLLDRLSLMLGT